MTPGQESARRDLDEALAALNEAAEVAAYHGLDQTASIETVLLFGTEARPVRVRIEAKPLPYAKG
jgi:hypothetical protein